MLEFCSWMKIWETWCASTPLCFGNVEKVLWVRSCAHRIFVWPSLDTQMTTKRTDAKILHFDQKLQRYVAVDRIGGEAVEISMFSLWECHSDTHHGPVITNPAECVQVFYKKAKAKFDADPEFKKRSQKAVVSLQVLQGHVFPNSLSPSSPLVLLYGILETWDSRSQDVYTALYVDLP